VDTGIIKGRPSTHGDHYQLNTSTLIRHAARTYPEQEIVFRTPDGGWDRYTYADCYTRIKKAANVLRGLGVGPADVVGILDWNSQRHFELYWAIPNVGAVMLQMNCGYPPRTWATSPATAKRPGCSSTSRCCPWPRRWHRTRRTSRAGS
jgi:acyl-CoA synthetase (AMP-forming)/AMP-acid ligase II